jgi:hypothetical protein
MALSSQVIVQAGDPTGTIVYSGALTFPGVFYLPPVLDASQLPTADPAVTGQVWNNSGVLTVSTGP